MIHQRRCLEQIWSAHCGLYPHTLPHPCFLHYCQSFSCCALAFVYFFLCVVFFFSISHPPSLCYYFLASLLRAEQTVSDPLITEMFSLPSPWPINQVFSLRFKTRPNLKRKRKTMSWIFYLEKFLQLLSGYFLTLHQCINHWLICFGLHSFSCFPLLVSWHH